MAGYKETPRQKMISMMYLVLTALLALNVSKEILDAFLIVNESMVETNVKFKEKIDDTYSKFSAQNSLNPGKVGFYWNKALDAQKITQDMINYIEDVKAEVIFQSERGRIKTLADAKVVDLKNVKSKDKWDEPTEYFIGQTQDGSKGKARELREKIEEYKAAMINLVPEASRTNLNLGLETQGEYKNASNEPEKNWEMHNFYHTILAADITILNKVIAEVRNAEYDVVSKLYSNITEEDYTFDVVRAEVIPKSNYILTGQEYEAKIIVAAMDTKSEVYGEINGQRIEGDSGRLIYKVNVGSATGAKEFTGFINVKSPSGDTKYEFSDGYIVAQPTATVSADKMNVFYIGVDNPVTVSVPGIADELVSASIGPNGSIAKSGGHGKYNVKVTTSSNETTVNVYANFEGSKKSMGSAKYRVKRVPDPVATVGGMNSGTISKGRLLAAGGVISRMPEGFEFDLNFEVVSFIFSTTIQGGDIAEEIVRGGRFSPKVQSMIKNAKRNQKVYFENIVAKGPDGSSRKLSAVVLRIL
ncbi:gliding motility protein GldM [candidate division KSB1 bacterium]